MFPTQISLPEGCWQTLARSSVFLAQRQEIFQQNFLVVPVSIEVDNSRGVAHPGDGGRVELLVLQQITLLVCQL